MDSLRAERVARILMTTGLPGHVEHYYEFAEQYPPTQVLSVEELEALGMAVLLFCLFARICECNQNGNAREVMKRAIEELEQAPEINKNTLEQAKLIYDKMIAYKIIRENDSLWEMILERCWQMYFPETKVESPSAFHGYLYSLADEFNTLRTLEVL